MYTRVRAQKLRRIGIKTMNRRQEREEAFFMLFEREFDGSRTPAEVYENAKDAREVEESEYIRRVTEGVAANKETLDNRIAAHSNGWNRERISNIASAVMLVAVYEMMFEEDIPYRVSINEAVELMKKYDDEKARVFVNGVLNAVAKELEAEKGSTAQ